MDNLEGKEIITVINFYKKACDGAGEQLSSFESGIEKQWVTAK